MKGLKLAMNEYRKDLKQNWKKYLVFYIILSLISWATDTPFKTLIMFVAFVIYTLAIILLIWSLIKYLIHKYRKGENK